MKVQLQPGDALVIVDVQYGFLEGGNLAVQNAESVIPPLNHYLGKFTTFNLPVFATRDWHPKGHISFQERGGPWPEHCVAGTKESEISADLDLPPYAIYISKATLPDKDAYSGFDGTELDKRLKEMGIARLFIGGIATDYCVLSTVMDALHLNYEVCLLTDCIEGVNVKKEDSARALRSMSKNGAVSITFENLKK